MRIQIRYKSNRMDIFDTISFTKAEPFDGVNMLTNFEVRVDELGNTGLWLIAHQYEISDAYAKSTEDGSTPTARRKRGWRFLLAESGELDSIESLSIDGQLVLMRVAGELADMVRFDQMCDLWLPSAGAKGIAQRALQLFDTLCRAFPELSANEDAVARMCGFSEHAICELREQNEQIKPDAQMEDESWLSGFFEEANR